MKLEYQKIVDNVCNSFGVSKDWSRRIGTKVAERCETLADKPMKELTDDEIWACSKTLNQLSFARNVIAAHIAKQSEPEVRKVKHRTWLLPNGILLHCSDLLGPQSLPDGSKLLDEFEREVKV